MALIDLLIGHLLNDQYSETKNRKLGAYTDQSGNPNPAYGATPYSTDVSQAASAFGADNQQFSNGYRNQQGTDVTQAQSQYGTTNPYISPSKQFRFARPEDARVIDALNRQPYNEQVAHNTGLNIGAGDWSELGNNIPSSMQELTPRQAAIQTGGNFTSPYVNSVAQANLFNQGGGNQAVASGDIAAAQRNLIATQRSLQRAPVAESATDQEQVNRLAQALHVDAPTIQANQILAQGRLGRAPTDNELASLTQYNQVQQTRFNTQQLPLTQNTEAANNITANYLARNPQVLQRVPYSPIVNPNTNNPMNGSISPADRSHPDIFWNSSLGNAMAIQQQLQQGGSSIGGTQYGAALGQTMGLPKVDQSWRPAGSSVDMNDLPKRLVRTTEQPSASVPLKPQPVLPQGIKTPEQFSPKQSPATSRASQIAQSQAVQQKSTDIARLQDLEQQLRTGGIQGQGRSGFHKFSDDEYKQMYAEYLNLLEKNLTQ